MLVKPSSWDGIVRIGWSAKIPAGWELDRIDPDTGLRILRKTG